MADRIRFAEFEFDPDTGELWRDGDHQAALRPQLARLLRLFVERPGQLVGRDEIQRRLWDDVTVDVDRGLNYCVRQLRETLGDDARTPRFIETLPRKGYRFIAEVSSSPAAVELEPATSRPSRWRRGGPFPWLVAAALVAAGIAALTIRPDAPAAQRTIAPEAREAWLAGRYQLRQGNRDAHQRALASFRRAVTLEPDFAAGWSGLAGAHLYLARGDGRSLGEAEAAIERAFELDAGLADAHLRQGDLRFARDWDWAGAEAAYRRALELDPESLEALHHLATLKSAQGRHSEALAIIDRALALDPISALITADAAFLYLYAERFEEADALARRVLELEPGAAYAQRVRLVALTRLERWNEAMEPARELTRLAADDDFTWQANADGFDRYWRRTLERLEDQPHVSAVLSRAAIRADLGDRSGALDELELLLRHRAVLLPFLIQDPRFRVLEGEPRFRALRARLGLAPDRPI